MIIIWGYHDHHTNQKLVNPPSVLSAFVWCGCSSSDAGGRDEIWIGIWMTMRMIMMMMILMMMMMIRMVATTTTTMMTMNMLKWCWQDKRDMNLNPVPIEVPASLHEKWEWNCKQLLFKCAVLSVKKETFKKWHIGTKHARSPWCWNMVSSLKVRHQNLFTRFCTTLNGVHFSSPRIVRFTFFSGLDAWIATLLYTSLLSQKGKKI